MPKMVNGNYVLYGDRPASESEIVSDHVQTRTAERKSKRKANRTANELQHTLNLAELDNQTDSVKFENKIKEPRLIRYVPTSEVEENFITEKFETFDVKMCNEPPKRHTFAKKPKNPADGSVNYAYSRSNSSCSSPNGNLPTISEHVEQYGTYRVCSPHSPRAVTNNNGYEIKLDKYFAKPRELKTFTAKGSHPDSLYRVSPDGSASASKVVRALRLLRWPVALFTVCIALAVFVYFLMPVNMNAESDVVNATYWDDSKTEAQSHGVRTKVPTNLTNENKKSRPIGTKTPEIDFYDADNVNTNHLKAIIDTRTETIPNRKLPITPVFPTHISLEVQYGNEKADTDKARVSKVFKELTSEADESTLKPHITQKPEKPLAIYFKDGNGITISPEGGLITESFTNAETSNDIARFLKKQTNKFVDPTKPPQPISPILYKNNIKQLFNAEPDLPPEVQEYYARAAANNDVKFTSGHSKFFGISIEDSQNMKPTTQNSLYNTRVSPTLPTWKDRDDATTKKYPINSNFDGKSGTFYKTKGAFGGGIAVISLYSNRYPDTYYAMWIAVTWKKWNILRFELGFLALSLFTSKQSILFNRVYILCLSSFNVPQCRSTRLSLCRGVLPYDLAGAPATVAMVDVTTLLPQIEYLVSTNCSERVRHFACSLLEPECSPPPFSSKLPCYNFCKAIMDSCEGMIPAELQAMFACNQYSSSNCSPARAPCLSRELGCGDGSCVPRDWVCDGTRDCPDGEDEQLCDTCKDQEYRCSSGMCITKRWLCDGYADCANGEDERQELCRGRRRSGTEARRAGLAGIARLQDTRAGLGGEDIHEPGEEPAGSAPAPSVRKPNRLPVEGRNGENESSKELLMTSDSTNAFRRNYTRRPSPSRLTPYKRLRITAPLQDKTSSEENGGLALRKTVNKNKNYMRPMKPSLKTDTNEEEKNHESFEELNIDELALFDIEKEKPKEIVKVDNKKLQKNVLLLPNVSRTIETESPAIDNMPTKLDQSINKLERFIDGSAMLRKAAKEHQDDTVESSEMNGTLIDRTEELGYNSAHASPCPSSELRCVDGRCITLAQLCDGTIDCTDHADEDNCYT